ncbi:Chlorophyll synthase chloroplastic [Zea mays]|uniref:Chlorophyll synthase chloroplastic n=1 Tax=Zea mays TaxID=4577 RepID=A0A1D6M2M0_MAIZE|nr:Chlorophyll synthase chloroplastic [Zea mays]
MAAAHLLAALSSSTALRPPLRLRSPQHPPHIRFNCTGRRPFPVVRAAETDAKNAKANAKAPNKAPAADGSSFNQLLGIKGAKQESDIWKIRLQLTKPVTWPPLVWGVLCGAAASGMLCCL